MKKKTGTILIIVLVSLFAAGLVLSKVISEAEKNFKELVNMQIRNIDLTEVQDGVYNGKYKAFPVSVEVNVIVANHQITEIELVKHFNGQGSSAVAVLENVVEAQSLGVDVISGATYSSIVILKAVEVALFDESE